MDYTSWLVYPSNDRQGLEHPGQPASGEHPVTESLKVLPAGDRNGE